VGDLALRARISLVVIAVGLAGLLGAARAQPPAQPPADFSPAPPAPYPVDQLQPYVSAPPLPSTDVGVQANEPPGGSYGQAPQGSYVDRDANDVPRRPYVPQDDAALQPQPVLGDEPVLRPPADVGYSDVTGAVSGPTGAATVPAPDRTTVMAALPPEDQPEQGPVKELPPQLRRQLVDYVTSEPAGTIIIDTSHTYLYLVRGSGKALRYGIGVGREGFTWSGSERVRRMSEWPDWHPPKEMIERQPYLPRFMAGGDGNPLGARALYLGNTLYRIHGTNQPSTIGSFVSSGCIRLTNGDIEDLYSRISVGTRVVVLPGSSPTAASAQGAVAH
jgi:lipoprotein-anchoring transpeptidase ErfK/SrfK